MLPQPSLPGLTRISSAFPNVEIETLGYCRASLRDEEQILLALPEDERTRPSKSHLRSAILNCLALLMLLVGIETEAALAQQASVPSSSPGTNHVLELDGNGGHVELPPNIFNDLERATVEAWVRWDEFTNVYKRVFNYGDAQRDFSITSLETGPTLWFVIGDAQGQLHEILVPNLLRAHQWCHVAAVSGPGGMKVYLNGALAGATNYTGSFAGLKNGTRCYIGQRVTTNDPPTNFKGGIDEVRVWRVERTEAQIRQTMFRSLTGKEPGLAALWNFENVENGVVPDAGPDAHHGKLIGSTKVVAEETPGSQAPVTTSKVLELDGTNSFVEIPAGAFTNLAVATVEGWVKWESFRAASRFFDFLVGAQTFNVQNRFSPNLWLERDGVDVVDNLEVPAALFTDRWTHVAAVIGPETLKLFVDGALISTNIAQTPSSTQRVSKRNYLGRSNWLTLPGSRDEDFQGQMEREGRMATSLLRMGAAPFFGQEMLQSSEEKRAELSFPPIHATQVISG